MVQNGRFYYAYVLVSFLWYHKKREAYAGGVCVSIVQIMVRANAAKYTGEFECPNRTPLILLSFKKHLLFLKAQLAQAEIGDFIVHRLELQFFKFFVLHIHLLGYI